MSVQFVIQFANEIIAGLPVKAKHLLANFGAINTAFADCLSKTTSGKQTIAGPIEFQNSVIFDKQPVFGATIAPVHNSGRPMWTSNTSVTFPYVSEANSFGSVIRNAPVVVDFTAVGLDGIDTGSLGANQFWYCYAIDKPVTSTPAPGLIFSQTNELQGGAITLPSGYPGGAKIQMPFAVTSDGSSLIRGFQILHGWPNQPYVAYTSELIVLSSGVATSLTPFSVYTPQIAAQSKLQYRISFSTPGNSGDTRITNVNSFAGAVKHLGYATTTCEYVEEDYFFHGAPLATPGTLYYLVGGANESLTIQDEGFQITEVP